MKRRRGFTLLETLLALVILSSGLLLLSNSWSGAFLRLRKTQTATEVAALLERKMVEVELEYKDKPLDSIPEEKTDDFGSDYPQYSWRLESRKLELPDLSSLLTSKEGGADETSLAVIRQLTEQMEKSIREVKVIVIYSGGKKPQEYSVTTFFVNYDQQIAVPGMPGG